jgi:hypothetical protein
VRRGRRAAQRARRRWRWEKWRQRHT